MREIKFRGREVDTGRVVYGDFIHRGPEAGRPGIIDDEDFYHEVDPDTVAQLIGHDSQGREVYEGDKLADEMGNEYTATLNQVIALTDEKTGALQTISIDNAKRYTKLTLAEVA